MNDRAISLAGALLALLLVVLLLVPPRPAEERSSIPTSADRGPHGYYAWYNWIGTNGSHAHSLRQRYDKLDALAPGNGNLLVIALPQRVPARAAELNALAAWVERGNTVLLLVAGAGAKPWAGRAGSSGIAAVSAALGLDVQQRRAEFDGDFSERGEQIRELVTGVKHGTDAVPAGGHPLTSGVHAVEREQAAPLGTTLAVGLEDDERLAPALLRGNGPQAEDLWSAYAGNGRVLVLADPGVFANRLLGAADNARLANNLLGLALAPAGTVVFDDFHHGLSALYDARTFARDPRLHGSLGLLLGLWLIWIIGHGNRFGPLRPSERAESGLDFADAIGTLVARQAQPNEVGAALLDHFARDCRRVHPQLFGAGVSPTALARLPAIRASDLARYEALRDAVASGNTPDLVELTNYLHELRTKL